MQSKSDHRRPGTFPGRRFALLAATVVGALAFGVGAPPASADLNVVSALVFTGSSGAQKSQIVPLSQLQTCGSYTGPSSITLHSSSTNAQPTGVPIDSSWTLETVLQCGLAIQPTDVTSVTVVNGGTGSYETPLNSARLTDFGSYPGSGNALPTISVLNASIGELQYVRPWLGGSDLNGTDYFLMQPDSGQAPQPIEIVVSEKQQPLSVDATSQAVPGSLTSSSEKFTLSATVATAAGVAVPATDLSWSWSNNGTPLSTEATPTVSFPTSSNNPVSVQVYDAATGTGGTSTFDVAVPAGTPPKSGNHNAPGAGQKKKGGQIGSHDGKPKATGNTVPKKSHRQKPTTHHNPHRASHTEAGSGSGSGHQTQTTPESSTTTPAPTPPAAPPATTPATTPTTTPGFTPVNGRTKPPPKHRHPETRGHTHHGTARSRHPTSGGDTTTDSQKLVTGRLVADLGAASASSSPLVHAARAQEASAPLVHAAETSTSLPAWLYGALAVVVLLVGGAAYERRGRRGRSLHR